MKRKMARIVTLLAVLSTMLLVISCATTRIATKNSETAQNSDIFSYSSIPSQLPSSNAQAVVSPVPPQSITPDPTVESIVLKTNERVLWILEQRGNYINRDSDGMVYYDGLLISNKMAIMRNFMMETV